MMVDEPDRSSGRKSGSAAPPDKAARQGAGERAKVSIVPGAAPLRSALLCVAIAFVINLRLISKKPIRDNHLPLN